MGWSLVPLAAWAVYIGVGWAVAPRLCGAPVVLHTISAGILGVAAAGLAMAIQVWRASGREGAGGASAAGFGAGLGVKLGVLFVAGIVVAWVLAAVWCR